MPEAQLNLSTLIPNKKITIKFDVTQEFIDDVKAVYGVDFSSWRGVDAIWNSYFQPFQTTEKVLICDTCKGTGVIEHEELTCYHKRDYRYWTEVCKTCNNSGLIQHTTMTRTVQTPYTPKKPSGE